jgi:hypothetical protein
MTTTTTTKRRCGGVFAYGQMLLRVSKTFWRFSLSQERSAETMGAEKVEQKVPPGIECGEYRKPFNTCWNPAAAAAGPQILIWSLGRVVCCCSLFLLQGRKKF